MISRAAIEAAARAAAKANGDDYDQIPDDKSEWTQERGQFGGRFRDVNEPYKTDYEEMAEAAVTAALAAEGMALVPQAALDWLNGEGPDANGRWFEPPEVAEGERPKPYWWRSKFRAMLKAYGGEDE